MGISLELLVTMGSVSVGGMIVEKILGKAGKIEEAGMVGMVCTSMLATTVIGAMVKVFVEVGKLAR